MRIEQVPESRRTILQVLKRGGPATIATLAEQLAMTGEAVRQQLLLLSREGWVESAVDGATEPGRPGRPAARFRLTATGDDLFPKQYELLGVTLLDAVARELGPPALKQLLAELTREKVAAWEPRLKGLDRAARLQALRGLYLEADPYLEVGQDARGHYLAEKNCPFLEVASRRPALCSVTVCVLSQLLGCRVVREERLQAGAGRCLFRLHPDQPASPSFELEPGA